MPASRLGSRSFAVARAEGNARPSPPCASAVRQWLALLPSVVSGPPRREMRFVPRHRSLRARCAACARSAPHARLRVRRPAPVRARRPARDCRDRFGLPLIAEVGEHAARIAARCRSGDGAVGARRRADDRGAPRIRRFGGAALVAQVGDQRRVRREPAAGGSACCRRRARSRWRAPRCRRSCGFAVGEGAPRFVASAAETAACGQHEGVVGGRDRPCRREALRRHAARRRRDRRADSSSRPSCCSSCAEQALIRLRLRAARSRRPPAAARERFRGAADLCRLCALRPSVRAMSASVRRQHLAPQRGQLRRPCPAPAA